MIQKIQNFFQTDKSLDKIIFLITIYAFFWFLAYGIWMFSIIPDFSTTSDSQIGYFISPIYFFAIMPILSFFVAYFLKRVLKIEFLYLLIFNVAFLYFSLHFFIRFITSGFNFGGF